MPVSAQPPSMKHLFDVATALKGQDGALDPVAASWWSQYVCETFAKSGAERPMEYGSLRIGNVFRARDSPWGRWGTVLKTSPRGSGFVALVIDWQDGPERWREETLRRAEANHGGLFDFSLDDERVSSVMGVVIDQSRMPSAGSLRALSTLVQQSGHDLDGCVATWLSAIARATARTERSFRDSAADPKWRYTELEPGDRIRLPETLPGHWGTVWSVERVAGAESVRVLTSWRSRTGFERRYFTAGPEARHGGRHRGRGTT